MTVLLNALCAVPLWVLLFSVRLGFVLSGLFVVALALPFASARHSERVPTWAEWQLVRLPWWAWPWDNLRDGCMGDRHGNFWFRQAKRKTDFGKKYEWLAIRNPCNNFSRFLPGLNVNIDGKEVLLLAGREVNDQTPGVMFTKVKGLPYWGFWYVGKEVKGGRRWNIRLGHKLQMKDNGKDWSHDQQKAIKGFTFRISKHQS